MWVRSLGREEPLEDGTATHSSILAWRIPWKEEPGGYIVHRVGESDTTEAIKNACTGMEETAMNIVGGHPDPRNLEVICILISP